MNRKQKWVLLGMGALAIGTIAVCLSASPEEASETVEALYVREESKPIVEGWNVYESVGGERLTEKQKNYIDNLVKKWSKEELNDEELREELAIYFAVEEIETDEISIVSNNYTLQEHLPEVSLEAEGMLYQYLGIYSKGEMLEDVENPYVCYQWSVLIF